MLHKQVSEETKGVIFKNCTPFNECTSEINNIQIDPENYLDLGISMYNLIEYNNIS